MPDGTDRDAENAAAAEEILAEGGSGALVAGDEKCVLNHTEPARYEEKRFSSNSVAKLNDIRREITEAMGKSRLTW